MIAAVAERTADIRAALWPAPRAEACTVRLGGNRRHRSGTSDFDFVVEFQPPLPAGATLTAISALLEDLERLLGGPVELVVGSAIKNPYFRQSVEQTSALLYEA